MNRTITLAALLLVVGMTVATAPVSAAEDPRFETYVPEPTVAPGQTQQLTVQFVNDANEVDDRVKTARNVKATMRAGDTPFTVSSGTHLLGVLRDGVPATSRFAITAPEDVDPGTYRLPIKLTYEFDSDERESTTVYATVEVQDRASFRLVDVASDLSVGDRGTVQMQIENVGTENASAATVAFQSKTGNVLFGTSAATSTFVGDWQVNETKTVTVDANAPETAENGTYAVTASVSYDDEDGTERASFPMTGGVTVGTATDRFSLSNVQSSLRVGEDGTISMTVTNNGDRVTDAVVHIAGNGMNVHPQETEYAIGELGPSDSVDVTFPIEVSESAKSAPRQFGFTVSYQSTNNKPHQTKPLNVQVPIGADRDRFTITPKTNTITAGGSGTIELQVTNNGEQPVSNVNAKLFANDPLSASDDEAFVDHLGPGESTTITFGVGVAGSALEKTYPLSLDFKYDENGDSKLSKSYQVPVQATQPESSGLPVTYIVVAVVLVVAAGAYLWYRRQ